VPDKYYLCGEMKNLQKILVSILNGKGHYVLGVDEMVILKLMLKLYGIGMSILCNRFSTEIIK